MLVLETKLLSLRDYSMSFNSINAQNNILREQLIDEIEELSTNNYKLIIIEGSEGTGKTNLLLQFASKHNFDSFTYFINPSCRFTYNQDYLMEDLGKQMLYFNKPEMIDDELSINEGVFNKLCLDLLRTPGKKNKPIFFVLDGLDQIEKSDIEILKPILHSLPWLTNNFFFVVSGEAEKLRSILPHAAFKQAKQIRVTKFNFEETCRFFGWKDEENKSYEREVYDTWKGHPERLSQVKRILDTGIEIKDFLSKNDIKEKNDLLEIEWNESSVINKDFNDDIIKVLSILAFDDNITNINKIASILYIEIDDLKEKISEISFITIKSEDIKYVSNSFRLFASLKLKKYEKKILSVLIGYFTEQNDLSSVLNLPTLFEKNQEWNSIINILTVNNLGLIISNSQSFADIKKQINYGYKASKHLKKAYENIFRFSLYRSTINGLQRSDTRENQIKAYIALGKQDEALSLISNAVLKEDRLKMLIRYSRECKVRNIEVETIIIEEIKELLKEIDESYIRENLTEIAIGLAYFLPDLAVQTIEKASGLKNEKGSLEWLLGYISLIINNNKESSTSDTIKASGVPESKSSFIDNFTKSIGYGINSLKEDEIIEKVSKTESLADRLFLLRKWINRNLKATNIYSILDYALNLLLQDSSTNKPTTTILLDIAKPILHIQEVNQALNMISRFDDLLISINNPTIDRIRISLLLIERLTEIDIDEANNRCIKLYEFIEQIPDLSLKVDAIAECWVVVKNLEESNINIDQFILDERYIRKSLLENVESLLLTAAEQSDELENCIRIIAKIDFDFTLLICSKLNTNYRRSEAILVGIATYVELPIKNWDEQKLKKAFALLSSETDYTAAIHEVFDSAYDQKNETKNHLNKLVFLIPAIEKTKGNTIKCYLLCKTILLLNLEPDTYVGLKPSYKSLVEKLKHFLQRLWYKIDDPVDKLTVGYNLTSDLVDYDQNLATEYFYKTEALLQESVVDNKTHASSLIESIRLMIRVFGGMIAKDKTYSYDKISELISLIPSNINKTKLWSELSVRASLSAAKEVGQEIVSNKIIPLIESYKASKDIYYYAVLQHAASAIQLTQPETLKLYLEALPKDVKEQIITSVCFVLLTKEPIGDPFDDIKGSSKFNYQDAIEFINLITVIEDDAALYDHIKNLCNVAKYYPNNFIREQKIEIKKRLTELVNEKLPNANTGVNHSGYLITSLACIEQFNINQIAQEQQKIFETLTIKADEISNNSDRSFVYSILANECTVKKKKIELLNKAFEEADKIQVVREKIQRYRIALDFSYKIAPEVFQNKMKQIQEEVFKLDDSELFPTFRKLIDLAYKYDKNTAQRLISSIDTDPGRKQLIEPANDHFEQLEVEKEISSDYTQLGRIKDRRQIGNIVWRLLGELNSNKKNSRDIDQTMPLLHTASRLPFFYALPIFEFFLQNTIKNNASSDKMLLSFYDATYSNAKLCYNLICSITNKNMNALSYTNVESDNTFIVMPSMRRQALGFIEKNLRNSLSQEIYIIDPYFSQKDIQILKDITDWCYGAKLHVLTSIESSNDFSKYSYLSAWKDISSEEPPNTYFVSASNQAKKAPFHDRYIILHDKLQGLRIGTSFNSLGGNKISEISTMLSLDVQVVYESIIVPLIKQRSAEFEQNSVKYETFDL